MNPAPASRRVTRVTYRVPYADTDQMGVIYYANYLVYFERARNETLREHHGSYRDFEALGFLLPVVECHCRYHAPGHYDDLLDLSGWFEPLSPVRIAAHCEVRRGDALLASGHTVHVCLDARSRKPVRLPAGFSLGTPTRLNTTPAADV